MTIRRIKGSAIRIIGNAIAQDMDQAFSHLNKTPSLKPKFNKVLKPEINPLIMPERKRGNSQLMLLPGSLGIRPKKKWVSCFMSLDGLLSNRVRVYVG